MRYTILTLILAVSTILPVRSAATLFPTEQEAKPTMRLYVCDEARRPDRPHGNTLETDRAKLVINESFCRTT